MAIKIGDVLATRIWTDPWISSHVIQIHDRNIDYDMKVGKPDSSGAQEMEYRIISLPLHAQHYKIALEPGKSVRYFCVVAQSYRQILYERLLSLQSMEQTL